MNLPALTRKQQATAGYLDRVRALMPKAPAHELRYIFSQLKDADYIWQTAMLAFRDRANADNRLTLRIAAFFWSAGIRPGEGLLSEDAAEFIDKVAFLLVAHRKMFKWQLPTNVNRMWLLSTRERSIADHIRNDPQLIQSEHAGEAAEYLSEADTTIYCARNEKMYRSADKLAVYLTEFCLLPEDIGITARELARWQHLQWIEIAQNKFDPCRQCEQNGKLYNPDPHNIFSNIYSVLKALLAGVTLAEAGITVEELRFAKHMLELWFERIVHFPEERYFSEQDVANFKKEVMPLFDQVLNRETPVAR